MINWLHSKLHDPSKGWDPISLEYAQSYSRAVTAHPDVVGAFLTAAGDLTDKSVADLAAGPGHYGIEFARLGADVTCIDISKNYLELARSRFQAAGVRAKYILGYIDHLDRLTPERFDAIFSNISWNYCMNDFSFASCLLRALKPGGIIFVRETNEAWVKEKEIGQVAVYAMNRVLGLKIGHPHPPRGRIAAAFRRVGGCKVTFDSSDPAVDLVTIKRS